MNALCFSLLLLFKCIIQFKINHNYVKYVSKLLTLIYVKQYLIHNENNKIIAKK